MSVSRVEVRLFSFFGGLGSHYVGSNLLLFNLLDLCPVGRRLSLVIGLPARERGRLRSSLFQPCWTSGARTECSVSWSYPPPTTQRMIIKQHEWYDTDVWGDEHAVRRITVTWCLKLPKQRWFFAKFTFNYFVLKLMNHCGLKLFFLAYQWICIYSWSMAFHKPVKKSSPVSMFASRCVTEL